MVAVAVVISSFWAVRYSWRRIWADVASQKGFNESLNEDLSLVALADFRAALRMAPEDPVTQFRVATTILKIESQNLASSKDAYQMVKGDDLREARALMIASREGRHRPQDIVLRLGHTEALLAEYFRRAGDQKTMLEMSSHAANHFEEYRQIQGRPNVVPYDHYRAAMEHSMTEPFPQLALTQYDDFVFFFGEYSFPNPPPPGSETRESRDLERTHDKLDRLATDARYLLGEFPLMMHQQANLLFRHPDDPAVLRDFAQRALKTNEADHAILLLKALDRAGKATPQSQSVLSQLQARTASQTSSETGS